MPSTLAQSGATVDRRGSYILLRDSAMLVPEVWLWNLSALASRERR
ncbi:MAG TPA: hypothetical protein P5568_03615 [Acidobacteriota bacterium]|nr:hypothetical protein [Acidobacteriota bacterium]HRV07536.1 hypothetical protein [Acidobacteriota bacterium]